MTKIVQTGNATAARAMLAALREIEIIAKRHKFLDATGRIWLIARTTIATAEAAGIESEE